MILKQRNKLFIRVQSSKPFRATALSKSFAHITHLCHCPPAVLPRSTQPSPRSIQPSIPPGSVNEYQLRLGRQRQVWLIPIADERVGVQVKLWNPLRTRAIPERFCGGDSLRRGAISSVWTFTLSVCTLYRPVKSWVLVCWSWRFDWSLHVLQLQLLTPPPSIILSSNKIQNRDILVPAYRVRLEKRLLEECCVINPQ